MIPPLHQAPTTPEQWLELDEAERLVNRALHTLTPREERVLRLRYGLADEPTMLFREIADHFSVTMERVRQIHDRAIRKLRHRERSRALVAAAELLDVSTAQFTPTRSDAWE